jgi:aconitate hydratase
VCLEAQGRGADWIPLTPDADAAYDETIEINLSELEPLAACPHMPDNVKPVRELAGIPVEQVCIGSCTNSSLRDLEIVAAILKGKTVAPGVSLTISPGSKQVFHLLARSGGLADMIAAGARVLECACGPCIGMGQSPGSAGVSLRTFNRNFESRSGTKDGQVFLVSPEVAAASALAGMFADPTTLGPAPRITLPERFLIDDNMIELPVPEAAMDSVEIAYGPNIKPFPQSAPLPKTIAARAVLKVGDNITTDHIMPAGAKILPYRSNIPYLSRFCFAQCDSDFAQHCKEAGCGIILGGANYGQGSSREHAALVPLYLGIKAVVTQSFARIHAANLVNAGILPFTFSDPADYGKIDVGDDLALEGIRAAVEQGAPVVLKNVTKRESYALCYDLSQRQREIILAGGLLDYTREH